MFSIPYDIDILQEVFRVPSRNDDENRPLYNRKNKFFTARSVAELIDEIEDVNDRNHWKGEMERIKGLYNDLSQVYQENKGKVETASTWK